MNKFIAYSKVDLLGIIKNKYENQLIVNKINLLTILTINTFAILSTFMA
jgi:hypothetical protein